MKEDKITGGLADNHTPESIAKLHGVTIEPAHEGFKLMSLNEYVNEKYYSYADFESSGKATWGSKEELKNDAKIAINRLIPVAENGKDRVFNIKSIDDQSTDSGIKFEVKLDNGDILHLYKNGKFRGEWEFYLNKKKTDSNKVLKHFIDKLTPLQQYIRGLKIEDWNSQYSDDYRMYSKKGEDIDFIGLYKKLNNSDKKKAYNAYLKHGPNTKAPDFKTFAGL